MGDSLILAAVAREFVYSNYIEAGLWIVLGSGAAAQAGDVRRDLLILEVDLITFGVSDLVETRTGAWWRPWWLLAWKAACVGVMLALLANHLRRRRRR
jgi:hypothetical protein